MHYMDRFDCPNSTAARFNKMVLIELFKKPLNLFSLDFSVQGYDHLMFGKIIFEKIENHNLQPYGRG